MFLISKNKITKNFQNKTNIIITLLCKSPSISSKLQWRVLTTRIVLKPAALVQHLICTEQFNFNKSLIISCVLALLSSSSSSSSQEREIMMARACKKEEEEKMDKSQTYPDFFKVFIPEVSSQKLLIPAAFLACLDKKLPGKIILRNLVGSLWEVKVVYTRNDGVFFVNGWEDFVKDNSLVFGDFLVFRYNGDCIIHFRIYVKCGCEKEDARASLSIGKRLSYVKEEEEDEKENEKQKEELIERDCNDDDNGNNNASGHKEDEEEEPKPRAINMKMGGGKAKPCGRGRRKKGFLDFKGCKVRAAIKTEPYEDEQPPAQETESDINAPMPANPSFMAILRSYNISKNYMLVPADFARICKMQVTKSVKLRVSNGKEWCVRCVCNGDRQVRISKGWAAFVWENDLKEGDTCVFELIQTTDIVMKVTISAK